MLIYNYQEKTKIIDINTDEPLILQSFLKHNIKKTKKELILGKEIKIEDKIKKSFEILKDNNK